MHERLRKVLKESARLKSDKREEEKSTNQLQKKEANVAKLFIEAVPKSRVVYFSCTTKPRDPKRKSEITLHNVRT